jgi:WD40 repeat protein
MDSGSVLARFEAERQALAMMDHPNIARVFDGGMTDEGRPYFAMEYVKGLPLTEYCDQAKLSVQQRLKLFLPICKAVQHAHQKGIIHRDLKPNNILICLYDGKPVPKVIDFGLAKAMHQPLTEKTLYTAHGMMVGTPLYMSPEQAESNNLDVDTRTDVYSLGVILYELLTGGTPLEKAQLKQAAVTEILRLIKEVDPPKPSSRLSGSASLPSVAAQRSIDPAHLTRSITGDLDWVVMKALEKERSRRYETANGLAADIERHLRDEPVNASPPSTKYRMQKFIKRNKRGVLAASLVLFVLLMGMAGTTWGLFEARRLERIARSETVEKERARAAEAVQVKQRDAALIEKDAALKRADGEAARVRKEQQRAEQLLYIARIRLAHGHWEQAEMFQARRQLESTLPSLRGWEYGYLKGLFDRGQTTLRGHTGRVDSVAFSPNGKRIVSGSWDNTIKVWDAVSGKEVFTLRGHTDKVRCVAYRPDGRRIISGSSDNTIKVWNAETGKEILALPGHTDGITSLAYSPDSRRFVSGSNDGTIKVWDAESGKEIFTWQAHSKVVQCVAFSPDGRRIASGGYGPNADGIVRSQIKLWDAESGDVIANSETYYVNSLAFSPDGQRIVSRGELNKTIKVWSARTVRELLTLRGHTDNVWSVAFSPDSERIVSGSRDRTVRVWSTKSGREIFTLRGHSSHVRSVSFSPDGLRIVSGSGDETVKVWDVKNGQETLSLKGTTSNIHCVAYSPDGLRIVSGSQNDTVKVWDCESGREILTLQGHTKDVKSVAFNPDGTRIVSGSQDNTIKVWDANTGEELLTLRGHTENKWGVWSVAYSPDGQRIVSAGGTVRVWDAKTGKEILTLPGNTDGAMWSVAYRPDGRRIVSGGDETNSTIKVWDAETGEELLTLRGHVKEVNSVAYSPDGRRFVSGSWDNTIKVWDAESGKEIFTLRGHTDSVNSVTYSPDGRRIVSASRDNTIKVWDAESGEELLTLRGYTSHVHSVAFSPDGQRVVSGGRGEKGHIKVWDASNKRRDDDKIVLTPHVAKPGPPEPLKTLVPADARWRWLHPTDGVDPATASPGFHSAFYFLGYDDGKWESGQDGVGPFAGFGYGDKVVNDIGRPINEDHRKTAYFRHEFTITEDLGNLVLSLQRDDGIIVYLDGKEVARDNVGKAPEAYDLFAVHITDGERETRLRRYFFSTIIQPGRHVLAISLHNRAGGSSDLRLAEVSLRGIPNRPKPLEPNDFDD